MSLRQGISSNDSFKCVKSRRVLSLGSRVGEMFCFTVNNNTIHQLKTNELVSAGWD